MTSTEARVPAEVVEARLAVYRFLLSALSRPSAEQHAWLAGPEFRRSLEMACVAFGLACPPGPLVPESAPDHESRYIACFEVGLPEPPVVLQASHYDHREPVPRTIHEHILFYHRFGARLSAENLEPADHLINQLAFLVHLDELLLAGQVETESLLRARHDFLTRQVVCWTNQAAEQAEAKQLPVLYQTLLALLAAAVEQDSELTAAAAAD